MEVDPIELYSSRVLVFMETEPQSNKYNQVILNPEMFKNMSDTISIKTGKKIFNDLDECNIELSDEEYELPDLKEIYGKRTF